MKNSFILFLVFVAFICHAQINSVYQQDLSELRKILSKTPGYKTQIKGNALKDYDKLFTKLKIENPENVRGYDYFSNLAQLFYPIRDNHLGFYQTFEENHFRSFETYTKYLNSDQFPRGVRYNINLDSLESELRTKPAESVEGIYHLADVMKVGVFKLKDKEYSGIVLSSNIKLYNTLSNWDRGEAAIHLFETQPNQFKAIYLDPLYKFYTLYSNEKYMNSSLINSAFYGEFFESRYTKLTEEMPFINLKRNRKEFEFKKINDQVNLIQIKNFEYMRRSSAIKFLDSIKPLLNTPYLIFDLRNNEGGSGEVAKHYIKTIKNYAKRGHTYLLVNNGTMSQGEIVTAKLMALKNVTIVGQNTWGTLAYGSNYGTRQRLPSDSFIVYITDMNDNPELLPFENTGVKPDVYLDHKRDWIQSVVEMINR